MMTLRPTRGPKRSMRAKKVHNGPEKVSGDAPRRGWVDAPDRPIANEALLKYKLSSGSTKVLQEPPNENLENVENLILAREKLQLSQIAKVTKLVPNYTPNGPQRHQKQSPRELQESEEAVESAKDA